MDKRYQVFISSTFVDLQDERQSVLKAILELDHMPAGMELFPASDEAAWQLIRDVIDGSDYYVLIIGGRYGSTDETGLSFTEREYDYAIEQSKPVIPLLHASPGTLPRERTETSVAAWARLEDFRSKVEDRHTCVYWTGADDLKAKVIVGLTAATKRHPSAGWIRADQVPTQATLADVLSLRNRIAELEAEASSVGLTPPAGSEDLRQGDDTVEVRVSFTARDHGDYFGGSRHSADITLTWNEIFASVAPGLINEADDDALRAFLRGRFAKAVRDEYRDEPKLVGKELLDWSVPREVIDTCIVQLRALGLIRESVRSRSVKDTNTYWTLTPYGDYLMTQLRAQRRQPIKTTSEATAAPATPRSRSQPTKPKSPAERLRAKPKAAKSD